MILLDTNLLGRITDSADPQCSIARNAIHTRLSNCERLIIVPQNLYEFWTVATRKSGPPPTGQNGLGMKIELRDYFNRHRSHAALNGKTPIETHESKIDFKSYRWQKHCRGLYQTPIAA